MGASIASDTTDVNDFDELYMELEWSAGSSPVGELFVLARTDLGGGVYTAWSALDFGAQILVSGNSGKHTINFESVPFSQIMVSYVRTSGSGTLDVWVSGKTQGGTQ